LNFKDNLLFINSIFNKYIYKGGLFNFSLKNCEKPPLLKGIFRGKVVCGYATKKKVFQKIYVMTKFQGKISFIITTKIFKSC